MTTTVQLESQISEISEHLEQVQFGDIDEADIRLAKLRVIDVVGCAIGGRDTPGNSELLRVFTKMGGAEDSSLILGGPKLPAAHAAMLNAVFARSNDFEVMSFVRDGVSLPSHNASSTIPVALALAEANKKSGSELLTSMIVGEDIVARVSMAANWNFYQGFDGIGSLVGWGTTATAAKILGLSAVEAQNAFGLNVNFMGGSIQAIWDGVHAFKLVQGTPARDGILSAQLAAEGITGVEDALNSRFGYFRLYADGTKEPEILTKELGKHFYGESLFKAYPCGLPNHTPIDAALLLNSKLGVREEDIAEVLIKVVPAWMTNYYAKPFEIRGFPQGDAIFSFQYTTAVALLRGGVNLSHFTPEAIGDPEVNALISKIRVVEHEDPVEVGAEVSVTLRDGRVFSEFVERPKAHPVDTRMSEAEIFEKFKYQAAFSGAMSESAADALLDALLHLEDVDDVSQLAGLLTN